MEGIGCSMIERPKARRLEPCGDIMELQKFETPGGLMHR
jgi:hypothetical protein